jgi:hypothetical protein
VYLISPSIGSPNFKAILTHPVATLDTQGWFTNEKIKWAFLSSESDLYKNATDVFSKEILGSDSIVKRWAKISYITSKIQIKNHKQAASTRGSIRAKIIGIRRVEIGYFNKYF